MDKNTISTYTKLFAGSMTLKTHHGEQAKFFGGIRALDGLYELFCLLKQVDTIKTLGYSELVILRKFDMI